MSIKAEPIESSYIDKLERRLLVKVREKFAERIDSHDSSVIEEAKAYLENVVQRKRTLSAQMKKRVLQFVLDECFGFGPLGPFLRRPDVGDIYLEGLERAYIEHCGSRGRDRLKSVRLTFDDEHHMLDVIHRVIGPLGGALNRQNPMFEGTLPNGTKVYATVPPVSPHGPTLSIICRQEPEPLYVVPHWSAQFRYVSEQPVAVYERNDANENAICISLAEDLCDVYLQQCFGARSFALKTIRFSCTAALIAMPEKGGKSGNLNQCVMPFIDACGRNGKRLATDRRQIDLELGDTVLTCELAIPERTVRIAVGIHIRGPMTVSLSKFMFETESGGRKTLRTPRGPRNLALDCQ